MNLTCFKTDQVLVFFHCCNFLKNCINDKICRKFLFNNFFLKILALFFSFKHVEFVYNILNFEKMIAENIIIFQNKLN